MKKLTKGTVLLFAFLLTSMMFFSGCEFSIGEDIGEGTKKYEVLTLNDGGNISVTAGPSRVSVGVSPDDKVHLTYYEYDRLKCRVTPSNDGFSIEQTSEGSLNTNGIEDITILVPKGLAIGVFSAITGSGGVTLTDISANSVDITGGSGDIRFNRLNAGDEITISVGSANIRGSIKGSRSDFFVSNSSGSGRVTIEGGNTGGTGAKTLTVSTGSGGGNITFTE